MVGMAVPSLGAEGDDRGGPDRVDDRHECRSQLSELLERCEAPVRQTEEVELFHTEPIGRAGCFLRSGRSERCSGRNLREVAGTLRAVGGDHEMRLATLACETRQQRT